MVHLHENGLEIGDVAELDQRALSALRGEAGVPHDANSCHTAFVGPYVLEGHVPADLIKQLWAEKPAGVKGLVVPGMPMGSPGMGTHDPGAYTVMALHTDGSMTEYPRR